MSEAIEAARERLYRLPLAEFTSARNEAARALRSAGERAAAAVVAKLRRPTVIAWAIDQVAHRAPESIAALLEASEAMRAALASGGAQSSYRAAVSAFRAALSQAAARAEQALRESGHAITLDTTRRIERSLQAAATGDERLRDELRRGVLADEPEAIGWDALAGLSIAAPAETEPKRAAPAIRRERVEEEPAVDRKKDEADRRRREAEARRDEERRRREAEAERRRRLRELRDRAAMLERAAREKRTLADRAAAEAERARRDAEEAESLAQAARAEVERAEREP